MADSIEPAAPKKALSWTQVWQLPVLLVGVSLLGVGLYLAAPRVIPPDYHGMLDTVQEYLRAENIEEASGRLNTMSDRGIIHEDDGTRGRYYQYLGDHDWLVYADLYPVAVDTDTARAQLKKIVEAYERSEELGRSLDGLSMKRWAEALVLLGREDAALAVVDRIDAKHADARYDMIRSLIEKYRADGDPKAFARMLDHLEQALRTEKNKTKRLKQRQWIAELRARHYLDVDDPQRAIDYINREMQRLRSAGAEDAPGLLVLLGQAYQAVADFENARRLYSVVQQMVVDSDPLNGRVLTGMAQIELAVGGEGFEERAHVLFSRAAKEHPTGEAYLDALIGRAHVEAMQRRVNESTDHFRLVIAHLMNDAAAWDPRRDEVTDKIASHVGRSIDLGLQDDALDYLELLLPLYDNGKALPGDQILAQLNKLFAPYGVGRGVYTGDTVIGLKGRIVFEKYFGEGAVDRPHIAFSVTKSFVGTLAAILAVEGKLDANLPVLGSAIAAVGSSAG